MIGWVDHDSLKPSRDVASVTEVGRTFYSGTVGGKELL